MPNASFQFLQKIEPIRVREVSEIANQVCDRIFVVGPGQLLEELQRLLGECNVLCFVHCIATGLMANLPDINTNLGRQCDDSPKKIKLHARLASDIDDYTTRTDHQPIAVHIRCQTVGGCVVSGDVEAPDVNI